MPPKKDDKKKKGEGLSVKEIDPALYVRKTVTLPEPNAEKAISVPSISGKIINIENVFPEWTDAENWGEPIAPEKVPQIRYPGWVTIDKTVNFTTFYELDVSDAPVDPKKKKETKKPPAKGKVEEVVEMVELAVNDLGKPLPVVFRDDGQENFKVFPELKPFADKVISKDEATGNELIDVIDPLLCEAFKVVSVFAPLIIGNHGKNETINAMNDNYLWRAIYPKLPNGKPCYNPAGKYCVKVFLAGKWRKVYVDESIPLTSEGKPAIAWSSDRLELWPFLLAKAVYTVYSATGYTFGDELVAALHPENDPAAKKLSVPLLSSQFVAFILHLLTGWQHHQSVDASKLFVQEKTKSIRLLSYMVENGLPLINCGDILQEDNSFHFNRGGGDNVPPPAEGQSAAPEEVQRQPSAAAGEEEGGGDEEYEEEEINNGPDIVLKTKRRFKEEYIKRKAIRDEIVSKINIREQKVNNITKTIQQGSVEIFFVTKYDMIYHRFRVYPMLGIAFAQNIPPAYDNYLNIQFLLHWKKYDPVDTIPNVDDPIILGKGKIPVQEFLEPFPKASPVDYLWDTVHDLIGENAYVTALFTTADIPNSADYSRHWISNNPEPNQAIDPKAKDAKKGGKDAKNAAPAAPVDETMVDPGSFPVTFLTVDPSSLYDEMEAELKAVNERIDISKDEAEIQEALKEQSEEMQKLSSENGNNNNNNSSSQPGSHTASNTDIKFFDYDKESSTIKKYSIKLLVTLIADIHSEINNSQSNPVNVTRTSMLVPNFERQGSKSWDDLSLPQTKIHPSDTLIILQEMRFDHELPLMFIMNMKDTQHLPFVSKSFTIPFERLTSREPIVFWVRIFTRSSICFKLNSNVKLSIGAAESIWKDSLHHSIVVKEGDSEVTVNETEQLLIRLPIEFETPKEKTPEEKQQEQLESSASEHLLPQIHTDNGEEPKILIFLYVKEFVIEKLLNLLLLTSNKDDPSEIDITTLSHPLGQLIPLKISDPSQLYTFIAYITPVMKELQIPKFHWKLLILSKNFTFTEATIGEGSKPSVQESPISQRYIGKYVANNELKLFRDVYSFDKTAFPIGFKFNVHKFINPSPPPAGGVEGGDEEQKEQQFPIEDVPENEAPIPFLLRLYRKSDLSLVAEYAASGVLHVYSLDLKPFLAEPGTEEANAAATKSDPKAAKAAAPAKGGKNAPAVVVDAVDIIFECVINDETVILPDHWYSRFPHVYDEFFPNQPDQTNETIQFYQETLKLQNNFLAMTAPRDPILSWKLDILAGKVTNVSHDITALLKYQELKKQWEAADPNGNRLERALASASYIKEREDRKNGTGGGSGTATAVVNSAGASNNPSRPKTPVDPVVVPSSSSAAASRPISGVPPGTVTGAIEAGKSLEITSSMVEALAQALTLENDEVKNRFSTLHKVAKIEEKVEVVPQSEPEDSLIYPHNPRRRLGSEMWNESVAQRRQQEKQKLEDYYQQLITKSKELNSVYRENCAERIQLLTNQYLNQRNELIELWKPREAFRTEIETKNASLNYLLKRGKDAKTAAKAQEDAAEAERLKQEAKNAKGKKK